MGRRAVVAAVATAAIGVAAATAAVATLGLRRRRKQRHVPPADATVTVLTADGETQTSGGEVVRVFREITNLRTLEQVCLDAHSPLWVGQHVTSLVVRDAGAALPYMHPVIAQMSSLVRLDISGSAVHYLPYFVSSLVNLKDLNVSRSELNFMPTEVGLLSPSLTRLDLSANQLAVVPAELCHLTGLTHLNLMGNKLKQLPEDFGALTNLKVLGLKSNRLVELPPSFTRLRSLVELFITDNQLTALPEGFGNLSSLVKLQASFNHFTSLPTDLLLLPRLELMRVAVCKLESLPPGLHKDELHGSKKSILPRLAWCSLGGNVACGPHPPARPGLAKFQLSDLRGGGIDRGSKLGDGASGEVFRGVLNSGKQTVAVKQFRADVSPDGRVDEELAIACAVDHPNLTFVLGVIDVAPPPPAEGATTATSPPPLLVMRFVPGQPMAAKPTSQHLLRCKWDSKAHFTRAQVLTVASGLASALQYLHLHHICHGDFYAHNVLLDPATSHATLCDFGASFVYRPGESFWEAMEVRAFGLFLHDLVERLQGTTPEEHKELAELAERCTDDPVPQRPSFSEIWTRLVEM